MKFAVFLVATAAAYTQSYSGGHKAHKGDQRHVAYDYYTYAEPTTQVSPYEDDYIHIPTRPMATYEHRTAPYAEHREVVGWDRDFIDRSRPYHEDFNEYDKEDWDTDLWKQQTLKYGLDDERD